MYLKLCNWKTPASLRKRNGWTSLFPRGTYAIKRPPVNSKRGLKVPELLEFQCGVWP